MFGSYKKLKHWNEAGLISDDQRKAITTYERERHQGRFGRGIVGVALFAIMIGILSLIAANWMAISGGLKLGVHLALNIALAVTVWHADRTGRDMVREGALLALGGLTLTLIGLIGQVFQLGGSMSGAFLVWQLAILPAFFIFGQTRMTVLPGLLALIGSVPVILSDYVTTLPDFWAMTYCLIVTVLLPLCLIADGHVRFVRRLRPVWAETSQKLGFILLTVFTTQATLLWYMNRATDLVDEMGSSGLTHGQGHLVLSGVFVFAVLCLCLHWLLYRGKEADPVFYARSWFFVLLSVVIMGLPIIFMTPSSTVMAIVTFLLYWGFIAVYAHLTGAMRLLSLAIFLLALRIWIVYLEAFGGLMSTGFGLISGGVLMLVMIYAARRVNRRLTGKGAAHV